MANINSSKMENKLKGIRSMEALSSVHPVPSIHASILEYGRQQQQQQQLYQQQQQRQQQQQQLQQEHQKQEQERLQRLQLHQLQLQLLHRFQQVTTHPLQLSPIQPTPVPVIAQHHSSTPKDKGSTSNHHSTTKQNSSRNSSFSTTKNRNGTTNKDTSVVNNTSETHLIDLITCKLCKGYLIDATTLELCMHSFCRPCALKYIRDEHRCPECNIEIKDKRFLNRLKPDVTLQSIVYKLVPGLYEKEMARRRKFYAARPTPTPRYKCEMFGDIPPAKTIKPDEMLNVSLTWLRDPPDQEPIITYLSCRADSTIRILKKLVIGKFGLERPIKFYYDKSEILFDLTALVDIAATFDWSPEKKVLALNFKEQEAPSRVEQN